MKKQSTEIIPLISHKNNSSDVNIEISIDAFIQMLADAKNKGCTTLYIESWASADYTGTVENIEIELFTEYKIN